MADIEAKYGSQVQGLLVVAVTILDVALWVKLLVDSMSSWRWLTDLVRERFPVSLGVRLRLRRGLFDSTFRLRLACEWSDLSHIAVVLFLVLTEVAAFASGEASNWENVWLVGLAYLILCMRVAKNYAVQSVESLGRGSESRAEVLKRRRTSGIVSSVVGVFLMLLLSVVGCLDVISLPSPLEKLFDTLRGRGLVEDSVLVSTLVVKSIFAFFSLLIAAALNEIVFLVARIAQPAERRALFSQWKDFFKQPFSSCIGDEEAATGEPARTSAAVRGERWDRRDHLSLTMWIRYDMLMTLETPALLLSTILPYNAAIARAVSEERRIAYIWLLYMAVATFFSTFISERFIYGRVLLQEIKKIEQG